MLKDVGREEGDPQEQQAGNITRRRTSKFKSSFGPEPT